MIKHVWCCNESGMVFIVDAAVDLSDALLLHLVTNWPRNIYFLAGAAPLPWEWED